MMIVVKAVRESDSAILGEVIARPDRDTVTSAVNALLDSVFSHAAESPAEMPRFSLTIERSWPGRNTASPE